MVAVTPIETVLNSLKRVAASIGPNQAHVEQKITALLENARQSRGLQFFDADRVCIDIEPENNDEERAFLHRPG